MIFFFIITLIYFIIRYYTKKNPSTQKVFTALYGVTILISQYIVQLNMTKELCGEPQISSALYVSLVPWIFIFGTMMIVLSMFPSWLRPFSNTFGYLGAKLNGVNKLLENILPPCLPPHIGPWRPQTDHMRSSWHGATPNMPSGKK